MKVAIAVVAVVLVSGVAQGQILRWDNGQPIPGTEFVDPVRYAAGDLTGYVFQGVDFSYADLHGLDMTGTSWSATKASKVDLRGTRWSGANPLPSNWAWADLRGAYYPGTDYPVWIYNGSGIDPKGSIRPEGGVDGGRWLTVFNGNLPARTAVDLGGGVWDFQAMRPGIGLWPVLDGTDWQQPIQLGAAQVSSTPRPMFLIENPLRLSFRYGSQITPGKTFDVIDWPYGVKDQFEFVEVPDGSKWDLTKLYTTGEARLIEWPETSPTEFRKFYQSDLDLDADVDSADLLTVLEGWTGADYQGPPIGVDHGDLDADGDLDSGDLLVLMSQWTGALAASRAAVVPEPSGLVLGIVGLMMMVRRVRK